MSCSRTSRLAASFLAALALAGCADDLPAPTVAEVLLRFPADPPSLRLGAWVFVDGTRIRGNLTEAQIDTFLPPGTYTFVVQKTCAAVTPSDTVITEIRAGVRQTLDFELRPLPDGNALIVRSEPPGLPVLLDGAQTGQVTPASFVCLAQGDHSVGVPRGSLDRVGFDLASADTARTVAIPAVGTAEVVFAFEYVPRPQIRGCLLELMTATYCPNCPKADAAADSLERDPRYDPEAFASVEVHLYWSGFDVLFTDQIAQRVLFYGNEQNAPYAFFNGRDRLLGASSPDLVAAYASRVSSTYGQDSKIGLYWSDVRTEEEVLTGNLRLVAIEPLETSDRLELHAFYAKDSVVVWNPYHVDFFHGVVRKYAAPVDLDILREEGAIPAGGFLDSSIQFDLAEETVEAARTPRETRLIAFVQNMATQEILQCREARIRLP